VSRGAAARSVIAVFVSVAVSGCGGGSTNSSSTDTGRDAPPSGAPGRITVLAAASLTEPFTLLGERFEAEHPGSRVSFSFAASSELATQISNGAPADVFASASPATMALVADAGDTDGEPTVFASNTLEIAVPAGNPADVTGLDDFAREDLSIALCAPEVPCGAAAAKVFAAAGVTPAPDTLEADVKATLGKVTLGEVDAALVYRTDVLAAGDDVEGIDFPEAAGAVNDYPIAVLADAPNAAAAEAFVALVTSPEGAEVLTETGFDLP